MVEISEVGFVLGFGEKGVESASRLRRDEILGVWVSE